MMTTTNGTRAAPMRTIEDELKSATAEINAARSSEPEATPGIDPNTAGENSAHAVHQMLGAADHIRALGDEFLSIAHMLKATGDALAADIEARVAQFDQLAETVRAYGSDVNGVFAKERARLSEMKMPGTIR